ncbi:ABC transporter substrate-binding protein [Noviherbaspirillum sp. CPCC 100848]|uniref:ABC transporter substrate-binding protein n=1 Tax=Noviherbaspirillum album TaxID=3080276 RepID=A0ABU6JAS5_9BURK|nr:ABC transporter substrate-binding protein [Noviherbaspirillum sp. CPCC 100848]MEC4720752.1 ABC transporter substrate-binding protein [Noviherbaspirillum sp. CPCC 100848]
MITLGLVGIPILSFAQQKFHITMVMPRDEQTIEVVYKDYLKKLNVDATYTFLRFSGKPGDVAELRASLQKLKTDLVYTWGTPTTLAVAGTSDSPNEDLARRNIPVVFVEVTDPVGTNIIQSFEKPGRNVTGITHVAPLAQQINTIKAYRPVKRVGYITNPAEPNSLLVLKGLAKVAAQHGFEVIDETLPLNDAGQPQASQIPAVVKRIADRKVDFLYIGPSTFLAFSHRDAVTQSALEQRLPTFCATESIVRQAKCLVGLFSNGANLGRFAAHKTAQILIQKKPADQIPSETLQRMSLLINMPVARQLDLYPPIGLLNVSEVISETAVRSAQAH